jgi:hypothetical protein
VDAPVETPAIDAASAPQASAEAPAKKPRAKKAAPAETEAHIQAPLKVEGAESEMTDNPVAAKNASDAE